MAFQMALAWTQFFSPYPPTSIWLITSNCTEHHERLLKFCGDYYQIPTYTCRQGFQNQFFKRSWSRKLKSLGIECDEFDSNEKEKGTNRRKKKNDIDIDDEHDNDDDDDSNNDDDNDDDDNLRSTTKTETKDRTDECNDFISNFISSPSSHVRRKTNRNNLSSKLSKYPKIRPAKQFLSFHDKETKSKRFIPQTRNIQSSSDRKKFHDLIGGRVTTRSSAKRKDDDDDDNNNNDDDLSNQSSQSNITKSKKRQKTSESSTHLNLDRSEEGKKEEKERKKDDKDDLSFQAEFERRKKIDENENSADIPEHSLFLFDDLFSSSVSLSADSSTTVKGLNAEFIKRLSFIKELFCEKCHLLRSVMF